MSWYSTIWFSREAWIGRAFSHCSCRPLIETSRRGWTRCLRWSTRRAEAWGGRAHGLLDETPEGLDPGGRPESGEQVGVVNVAGAR
jgi:hypothetical protein